jgi:hypothetical protein
MLSVGGLVGHMTGIHKYVRVNDGIAFRESLHGLVIRTFGRSHCRLILIALHNRHLLICKMNWKGS